MTHDQLIHKAMKWLWSQGCVVVITEMASGGREEPDAIGFFTGYSIVIECKTNHADFLNDRHKIHSRSWWGKMGDKRYYLAPRGIIKPRELPEKHGLLEPHGQGLTIIKSVGFKSDKNWDAEQRLLISAIRRIKGISPNGANVRCYQTGYDKKARATLGVAKKETHE